MSLSSRPLLAYRLFPKLLVALLAGACFLWASTPSAQADPHAVFYTVIGQQQLFFNVLAALDQADYVEPQRFREALLKKRAELKDEQGNDIGFKAESDQRVTSTETELSSILTRGITLEGNDLWTAYLARQFALEAARRNNVDEVLRIYCERGLGVKGCEPDLEDPKQAIKRREAAYVSDPAKRGADLLWAVQGVMSSSFTGPDQVLREQLARENDPRPYPFDTALAQLRENVSRQKDDRILAVERLATTAENAFSANTFNANALSALEITDDGEATLPPQDNEPGGQYAARYMQTIAELLKLPRVALATAQRGAGVAQQLQQVREQDGGALGDIAVAPLYTNGRYTSRVARLTVPAHVKTSATADALNAISNTEQNLAHAVPEGESTPGEQQLVQRAPQGTTGPVLKKTTLGTPTTAVAGATTASPEPRVLHAISDLNAESAHHDPRQALGAHVNPAGFHHEQGPAHLLQAIGFGKDQDGCGCQDTNVGNDYGTAILQKIAGF